MKLTKQQRQAVRDKFDGKCAYTGKDLGDDWQVDHVVSQFKFGYTLWGKCKDREEYEERKKEVHHINNLFPALKIVNHYKRSLDLEGFRRYMTDFHKRLAKLPKTTRVPATERRIAYMNNIADAFDITVDKPFSGLFYFERVGN